MEPRGNLIELSTFLKYGLTEVTSHKTVETGGKTLLIMSGAKYVLSLRLKLKVHWTLKVVQKTSALSFINDGTNSVTKHQV